MLYSRQIAPSCSYCWFGRDIGSGEIACTKRGIMSVAGYCRRYRYDPLKREPERPPLYLKDKLSGDFFSALEADLIELSTSEAEPIPDAALSDDADEAVCSEEPAIGDGTDTGLEPACGDAERAGAKTPAEAETAPAEEPEPDWMSWL